MRTDWLTQQQKFDVLDAAQHAFEKPNAVWQDCIMAAIAACPEPPIAMPTEREINVAFMQIPGCGPGIKAIAGSVLTSFVTRRNSPPEPSLREKCIKLARGNDVLSEQEAETLVDRFLALVEKEKAK